MSPRRTRCALQAVSTKFTVSEDALGLDPRRVRNETHRPVRVEDRDGECLPDTHEEDVGVRQARVAREKRRVTSRAEDPGGLAGLDENDDRRVERADEREGHRVLDPGVFVEIRVGERQVHGVADAVGVGRDEGGVDEREDRRGPGGEVGRRVEPYRAVKRST